jgi:hypothetical protein
MIGRSAKSHRYYYYQCNGSYKQGTEVCDSKNLPKEKLERLVVEEIERKILNQECIEELVVMVNEELDSSYASLKDRLDSIDAELDDASARLSRLSTF